MNERIHILRQSIVVVTQALTKSDIAVTQQGLEAFVKTDPKTGRPTQINLPYLPDNSSDTLIDAVQGFLDQEVAKYLFTDFSVKPTGSEEVKALTNLLEEARVERMMGQKYQGSNVNMRNAGQFFIDELIDDKYKELVKNKASDEEISQALMLPMLRALSGQEVFEHYLKDKMKHIKPVWDMIAPFKSEIQSLNSTKDVADLAKRIYKVLKDEELPEMPDSGDDGEDEENNMPFPGSGSGGGTGEDEGEGESETGGAASSSGGDSDDEAEEGAEEDEKGKEAKAEPDAVKHSLEDGEPSDNKRGKRAAAILDALKDTKNNYSEELSKKIAEQAAADVKKTRYAVFTNEGDVIEPLEVPKSQYENRMFTKLEDKVSSMVGPMQKDLERAIQARSKSSWEAGLRRGKLNSASLARLAAGKDDRVFRKRIDSTTKDVAVSLVIDMSGSMSGSKIHTAAAAAYALSNVLDRLKIAHEVICFTTHTDSSTYYERRKLTREAEEKYGIEYSRYENLYMPIIKGYNERINTETKQRFGWLPHSGLMANNIDGECVEIAARRLMARKEAGKIMMVLSDGSPAGSGDWHALEYHLKEVVKNVEKSNVKVIGIGIQDHSVKKFYDKHVVIDSVEELPSLVISRLRSMLLA
ncbi:cobaltochelatase CobT-related protein [Acinetobacter nosocomialis]|uniref:cobaltochelatase CobT-related protein n=1 Tax=Acinetobacter nosocomialis TaxID=106654 RepID=UPI0033BF2672